MKKLKVFLFFGFILIYVAGLFIGSTHLTKTGDKQEMYDYLQSSVTDNAATVKQNIKSVAVDNAVLLAIVLVGGLFKIGLILIAAVLFMQGFSAGFSVTAVLRLFGIKGFILCGTSLLSLIFLIPSLALYGCLSADNLIFQQNKHTFRKKYLILFIFITTVFCIDSVCRGFLSSIFMKWAASLTKTA